MVAGNWKMNTSLDEARALAEGIATGTAGDQTAGVEVAVFPPSPWLLPVRDAVRSSGVRIGAQNCYSKESGAFTGEVSPWMLVGVCDLVLAGHSERRHVFGESDELVGAKTSAIIAAGLHAVLCVGETLEERQAGDAAHVVTRQLEAGLKGLAAPDLAHVTVAYEPVWAIGTGVAATPDDAQEMCATISGWLNSRYSDAADGVRILYGGSVTPENASSLFSQRHIDGALVGGASLKTESFLAIVRAAHDSMSV
jgi:triosephosphate isomerase